MARVTSTGTADRYVWGDRCSGWHLVGRPELSVIEESMPPGTAEVTHRHHRARQLFYVLRGALVVDCEGVRHELAERMAVEIPPMEAHQVRNESSAVVEFLVISQPPAQDDRHA